MKRRAGLSIETNSKRKSEFPINEKLWKIEVHNIETSATPKEAGG